MRPVSAVALLGLAACVPPGIRYPNPGEDGGTAADAGVDPDGSAPDDGGGATDVGESGEVVVTAQGAPVPNGGSFAFGPLVVGSTRTVAFALENGTNEDLSLVGQPPVAVSGADATSFALEQPAILQVPAGGSAAFSIEAAPTGLGPRAAQITIDHDRGTYRFDVTSTGREPGIYVGVGGNGRRAISTDGAFWTNEATFPGANDSALFRGIGYANGVFVAVGGGQNGLMMWSDNGVDWNDVSDDMGWFGGVAYGNGVFVAVGGNGRVLRSTDGRIWADDRVDFAQHFRAIAFGNGIFVAVGDQGRRAVSTDGLAWTSDITGGQRLSSVVFAQDRFVAVGEGGRRMISFDGQTWMNEMSEGLGLFDVAYGNGTLVAVGGVGVDVSFDGGVTWEDHPNGPLMNTVAFGNGRFVGTGDNDGVAFTSADGVSWMRHDAAGAAGFTNIVYGD